MKWWFKFKRAFGKCMECEKLKEQNVRWIKTALDCVLENDNLTIKVDMYYQECQRLKDENLSLKDENLSLKKDGDDSTVRLIDCLQKLNGYRWETNGILIEENKHA
jgi:hypothetical protein